MAVRRTDNSKISIKSLLRYEINSLFSLNTIIIRFQPEDSLTPSKICNPNKPFVFSLSIVFSSMSVHTFIAY